LYTAEFAYNNKVYTAMQISLFEANSRQNPRIGFKMRKKGKYAEAERIKAKVALIKAQGDMKKYADRKKGKEKEYWVDDFIMLSTKDIK